MCLLVIILGLSYVPQSDNTVRDYFPLVEVNHYFVQGQPVTAIIWWDSTEVAGRKVFCVVDVRWLPNCGSPRFNRDRNVWIVSWFDDQGFGVRCRREVHSVNKVETATQTSRADENCSVLPSNFRRFLTVSKTK